jgi:protein SCO1
LPQLRAAKTVERVSDCQHQLLNYQPNTFNQLRFMSARRVSLMCITALLLMAQPCCASRSEAPHVELSQLPQTWLDDDGQPLELASLGGRRVLITMAYSTCHRFCPMTIDELQHMQQRADRLGEALTFIIVSYDPVNDTPEVWHQYRQRRHLDRANWHFVRGSPADTRRLAQQLGFPFWIYDQHVIHESHAVIFDAQGVMQASLGSRVSRWAEVL